MIFYLSLWAILFFLSLSEIGKKAKNEILLFIAVVLLLLFAGFRYGIETDYWSYYRIFKNIKLQRDIEPGFVGLINIYRKNFSNSFNGFVFFISLFSMAIKYLFFRQLNSPFLALLIYCSLFYINLEYNVIRQGLAISFLSLSVISLQKRNIFKYFLFVGIASTIHISSLLFIPVYFLAQKRLPIGTIFFLIFLVLIIRIYFLSLGLSILVEIFDKFNKQIFTAFTKRLMIYLTLKPDDIISLGFIRRLVFVIFFVYVNSQKRIANIYFNIYFAGYIIYILFMGNEILATRMSLPFEFFMIPLFANSFNQFTMKRFYTIGMLSFILLLLYITTLRNGNAIPYESYLF